MARLVPIQTSYVTPFSFYDRGDLLIHVEYSDTSLLRHSNGNYITWTPIDPDWQQVEIVYEALPDGRAFSLAVFVLYVKTSRVINVSIPMEIGGDPDIGGAITNRQVARFSGVDRDFYVTTDTQNAVYYIPTPPSNINPYSAAFAAGVKHGSGYPSVYSFMNFPDDGTVWHIDLSLLSTTDALFYGFSPHGGAGVDEEPSHSRQDPLRDLPSPRIGHNWVGLPDGAGIDPPYTGPPLPTEWHGFAVYMKGLRLTGWNIGWLRK